MGYLDNVTLDWAAHPDVDIDELTELCVQALVSAVHCANGHRHDVELELDTLRQVSALSA